MSFVRTGMNGYTVSTETLGVYRCFYHIRIVPSATVSERGEFVYVDGKSDHLSKVKYRNNFCTHTRLVYVLKIYDF